MTKTINIVFFSQNKEDTVSAINEARACIDAGEVVTLEPSSNLIDIECLELLATWGFQFSPISQKFIK
jgi:hypothetical protein